MTPGRGGSERLPALPSAKQAVTWPLHLEYPVSRTTIVLLLAAWWVFPSFFVARSIQGVDRPVSLATDAYAVCPGLCVV